MKRKKYKPKKSMKCAACGGIMESLSLHGEEIERCEDCGAIFLDINELRLHRNNEVDGFETQEFFGKREDEYVERICPKCPSETMISQQFAYNSGIHIEKCPKCKGIFLDKGELLAIDNFVEKEKQEGLPEEIAQKVKSAKATTHLEFLSIEEENKKLYKVIDQIPGINFLVKLFS
jgi:Zn-finger nucleic acid-binding protein